MLDLAFGLTPTSRLGCQVLASRELDGMRVRLPSATRNFYVGDEKEEAAAAAAAAPAGK
jgi:ferredoxin-2, mitochondrial